VNSNEFPERVNVIKSITYQVQDIVDMLRADNKEEPDMEDVMEQIEEWAKDDFSCGYGHQANIKELIFTDENGEEL